MKALIRGKDETIHEAMKIEGIDWVTGAPLTNKDWSGGPYALIDDFTLPKEPTEEEMMASTSDRDMEIAQLKKRLEELGGM